MAVEAQLITPIAITTPTRAFEDHRDSVVAIAVFPNRRRMVTCSHDKTLNIWDIESGVVLKKMEGHHSRVRAVAVSGNGKWIASGDENGELIVWHGDSGEFFRQVIESHSQLIRSLDFSPGGAVLATGSWDTTTKLWSTETWRVQGNPIDCGDRVYCVRYSPCGELLAIGTSDIIIWNVHTNECIAKFKAAIHEAWNASVAWRPDGAQLLSAGSNLDPTIREWDASTWLQVGDPWSGHTGWIYALAVSPNGTFVASASQDNYVCLWRNFGCTIARFKHSKAVHCVTFSADSRHILSGDDDRKILEWAVHEQLGDPRNAYIKSTSSMANTINLATTGKTEQPVIEISTPRRAFEGHKDIVCAIAIFPDGRRTVTGSEDMTLHLWDLKAGIVLKALEGHSSGVWVMGVSGDGQLIASGDENGELIAWHGDTGKSLTQTIKVHEVGVHHCIL